MEWQLQEAKNKLSELIRLARTQGPQIVTLRGQRAAVILSAAAYDTLRAGRASIVDELLGGPVWDDDMIASVLQRSKTSSREPLF